MCVWALQFSGWQRQYILLQLILADSHKVSSVQVILLESAVAGIGNTSRVYSGTSKR